MAGRAARSAQDSGVGFCELKSDGRQRLRQALDCEVQSHRCEVDASLNIVRL